MEDPLKILQLKKTVKFGTKTIADTEPKIWNLIPENIKNVSPFNNFKALKVVYIFKVFGDQSCLMVAYCFYQITHVCEECNNLQDSKSTILTAEFWCFVFIRLLQRNNLTFMFLLLLSKKGLSPESCLAICYPRAQ